MRVTDEGRQARPEGLPHNLEAEESVLGAMLLSEAVFADVVELLNAEDFYKSTHRTIFEIAVELYARGVSVDPVTMKEELERRNVADKVGGVLYLHHLVESVPSPASAQHYARIVADRALLRRLILAAGEIMQSAYSIPEDPATAADQAEALIYSVTRRDDKNEVVSLRPVINQAIEDIEHVQRRESALAGLATHFYDIDELLSGLQGGNLLILAARPSVGKSALAINISRNVCVNSRVPVLFFSVEMSRWEVGMRLLCSEAGVPMAKVRAGKVATEQWSSFAHAAEVLHEAPLFIVDSGHLTLLDIRSKARRLRSRQGGLGLIVVDYLQLMSHHTRVESRQQEIAEISRGLKMLAKELDVPVLAVSQLNREPERRADGKPQLADLRESGSIEQDADVVMFIHREKDQEGQVKKDIADVIVAKHRNGPTGKVVLGFSEELILFRNLVKGAARG